jgi:hypothetical protein
MIPLTPLLISPLDMVEHVANVCEATEYPPIVTVSCPSVPDALPEPYWMLKDELRLARQRGAARGMGQVAAELDSRYVAAA